MNLNAKLLKTLLVAFVLSFLMPLSSVFAKLTVTIDFGTYPNGMLVSAINEPGFHFSSFGFPTYTIALSSSLAMLDRGWIEIALDEPADAVSFDYQGCDVVVKLFLNNVSVDTPLDCQQNTFTQSIHFDKMEIWNNGSYLVVKPMTFTFGTDDLQPVDGQFVPEDNRLNHSNDDAAAPVAIFCAPHGIQVRRIDPETGRGIDPPAINLFYEDIEAAGIPSGANLLLAEQDGVALYRLTTGEFQVNVLNANSLEYKWFVFVWDQCPTPIQSYHLNLKG